MFETINRDALIIFPKPPLYDWVKTIYPDGGDECPELMQHDQGDVFLIPEFIQSDESIDYVKENFVQFFEQELLDWTSDESLWPKNLTWELFQSWFHYSVQSIVMDTLVDGISKDQF